MHDAENYTQRFGPYCQCCGSRKVMTLDVSIDEGRNGLHCSTQKMERLWRALASLNVYELEEFVAEASSFVNVEPNYEVESGLFNYFADIETQLPIYYRMTDQESKLDLEVEDIEVEEIRDILNLRKHAFIRIWKSFNLESKRSFMRRATLEIEAPKGDPS